MDEGGVSPKTFCGDVGWTVSRESAFSFDGFDHGGFFATNVGTGTASNEDVIFIDESMMLEFVQGFMEKGVSFRVFVAEIDDGLFGFDEP